jgi:glycosyltransferase involved in cell wall biosynthesis
MWSPVLRIAILTNFKEFHPGFSLTGIVRDQITTLQRYGHDVTLFVAEEYSETNWPADLHCRIERAIPRPVHTKPKDIPTSMKELAKDHKRVSKSFAKILEKKLQEFEIVITHDFMLPNWHWLPYAVGLRMASESTRHLRFLHWIHSVPWMGGKWWSIRHLGRNHRIIYPNETDRLRVAGIYGGKPDSVRVIPHIKDLRTFCDFHPDTCEFIDRYPGVMNASIVQVYPASSDRLTAKRLKELIWIFKEFKQRSFSVCLVVANQMVNPTRQREDIEHYRNVARRNGLSEQEVIFTSEFKVPTYESGLPKRILRELMQCMNLFVFPSREESFGLVLPEASLSSGCLTICNGSLDMLREIAGLNGLFFEFGSYSRKFKPGNERECYQAMASVILARMKEDDGLQARTHFRRKLNGDYLYTHYYQPILEEARQSWTI